LLTFATNVIGTANVLEAARFVSDVEAVVVATSDKCYANRDDAKPFSEGDPLGGDDPYSASKGATELVTHAWRQSFFDNKSLASVRAGNVIGGGDWATDRLIPDLMRGFIQGRQVEIRAPSAIRPWQHVLEPLQGYLMLAERLSLEPTRFAESWNFGPDPDAMITVERLANRLVTLWGDGADWRMVAEEGAAHEAHTLLLDSQKSRSKLGWKPVWSLDEGMAATVRWYKAHVSGEDMRVFTERQIKDYESVC
jgi:CDP-glucose 4,6-dehydratase